jgi:hypothetical protein
MQIYRKLLLALVYSVICLACYASIVKAAVPEPPMCPAIGNFQTLKMSDKETSSRTWQGVSLYTQGINQWRLFVYVGATDKNQAISNFTANKEAITVKGKAKKESAGERYYFDCTQNYTFRPPILKIEVKTTERPQ